MSVPRAAWALFFSVERNTTDDKSNLCEVIYKQDRAMINEFTINEFNKGYDLKGIKISFNDDT